MQKEYEFLESMTHNETQFTQLIEHIPSSVITVSLTGTICYVNKSAYQHLKFSREEMLTTSIEEYIIDFNNESSWNLIKNTLARNQKCYHREIHLLCKDNTTIICDLNSFFLKGKHEQPEKIALVFRDITQERIIANELEKKNLEMARMNSELIKSNQELKRVSDVKTKFLSIASHELKTPLTSIKGYSEIIIDNMKDQLSPGIFRMIESVNRAADRLHDVINNMLDVTRIEQKRLRLKPENMDLKETIEECIEEFKQFTSQRHISVLCSIDPDLPTFYGDKMRMQQVFTNLFSNAIKFSPDYSEVQIKAFVEDEKRFHIIVKDQGIGIDKDEQDKIFAPFYEIAKTTSHSTDSVKFMGGGTGLGLSIVKGVIERHGGCIWVESAGTGPNRFTGSEFHVLLPLKSRIQWDDDETQIIKLNKILEKPSQKLPSPLPKEEKPKVLIIDDDHEAIEITRIVLQPSFEIITAASGEEGIRIAFQHSPALILLDLYLPGLDGALVCRILRSQEETQDIPIAFFSAATQNEEIERCYASGADDFIIKPFNGKEMYEKVMQLVMKRSLRDI